MSAADHMEWIEKENALHRTFLFADFKSAFAFMSEVARLAEDLDHHPSWSNEWNRVDIRLNTHSAGNVVTSKDLVMAIEIDTIHSRYKQ